MTGTRTATVSAGAGGWTPRLVETASCRALSPCPPSYQGDRHRMTHLLRTRFYEQRRGPVPDGRYLSPRPGCDVDCLEPTHQVLGGSPTSIPPDEGVVPIRRPEPEPPKPWEPAGYYLAKGQPYRSHRRAPGRKDAAPRTCRWCEQPFSAAGLSSRVAYCSPDHRRFARNLAQLSYDRTHPRVVPIGQRTGTCKLPSCGREFRYPGHRITACCSIEHRDEWRRICDRASEERRRDRAAG